MVLGEPPSEPEDHPDAKDKIVVTGTRLRRIYWPEPYHVTATSYRAFGPRARFDHHRRPGPFPQAAEDSSHGVFYAAPSLQCCLLECFGDEFVIDPTDARLTVLAVKRDLRVLDLRGQAAVNAGTVAAVNQDGDRRTTQDWGRYWYEHPDMAGIDAERLIVRRRRQLAALGGAVLRDDLAGPAFADVQAVAKHRDRLAPAGWAH